MKTVAAILAVSAAIAATYVWVAVGHARVTPVAPPDLHVPPALPSPQVAREHPAVSCLREWNCIGPVQVFSMPNGETYAEYSCEHGIIFLRKPDLGA